MLIAFKLVLLNLNLQNNLPDMLTWIALALALCSAVLFWLTSHNSSTKDSTIRPPSDTGLISQQPTSSPELVTYSLKKLLPFNKHNKFENRKNNQDSKTFQALKKSLQTGEVEIAAQRIMDMCTQKEFSWELVANALARNLPDSLPPDAEKLVQDSVEELPQKPSDMQLHLRILILSRWLALASSDDILACAKYWSYQGLAYNALLNDDNQTNVSAAIACYQTSVHLYERGFILVDKCAEIYYDLGYAYVSLTRGDIQANLYIAIEYFSKALLYYEKLQNNKFSSQQARINYQLGLAYKGLLVTDQQRTLEVSHKYLKKAISFYNGDEALNFPHDAELTSTALFEVYSQLKEINASSTGRFENGEI